LPKLRLSQLHCSYEPMRSCLICEIMLPWQLEGAVCSTQINVSAGNSCQGLIFVSAGPRLDTDRVRLHSISVRYVPLSPFLNFLLS
jgi:hypothetical protein